MLLYTLFFNEPINGKYIHDKYCDIEIPSPGTNYIKHWLNINDKQMNGILNKFNAINTCCFYFNRNINIQEIKNKTVLKKYNNIKIKLSYFSNDNININGYMLNIDGYSHLKNILLNDIMSYNDIKILINDIENNFINNYNKMDQQIIFDNEDNKKQMQYYIFNLKNK